MIEFIWFVSELREELKCTIENTKKDHPNFKPGLAIVQVSIASVNEIYIMRFKRRILRQLWLVSSADDGALHGSVELQCGTWALWLQEWG